MNTRINVLVYAIVFACVIFLSVGSASGQQFQTDNQSPSGSNCPNAERWYIFIYPPNTVNESNIVFDVTGSGSNLATESGTIEINNVTNGYKRLKRSWASSGSVKVKYYPYGGGDQQETSSISFTMIAYSAGTISASSTVCSGLSASINVSGNAGTVTFAKRNVGGSTWTDLEENWSGWLTEDVEVQARYSTVCGTDYSNIITINVITIPGSMTLTPNTRFVGDTDAVEAVISQPAHYTGDITWTIKNGSGNTVASTSETDRSVSIGGWSSTFTGTAYVRAALSGCDNSVYKESSVQVYSIPTANFVVSNLDDLPTYNCPGTVVHYKLAASDPNITISNVNAPVITGAGSAATVIGTNEWAITWQDDGVIDVQYSLAYNGRTFTNVHSSKTYDGADPRPGTISSSGPTSFCQGSADNTGTINISGNVGSVGYWWCTSGCATPTDSNPDAGWTNQWEYNGYGNVQSNIKYRVKLDWDGCPNRRYSNTVSLVVNPMPTDILLNGPEGVCEGIPNAMIVLNYGESDVKYRLWKDSVETGIERTGPGADSVGGRIEFRNQGIGKYMVVAKLGSCSKKMSGRPIVKLLTPAAFYFDTDPVRPISICPDDEVTIEGKNGSQLQWSSSRNDLSSEELTGSSIQVEPDEDTWYRVFGKDKNCRLPFRDSLLVSVRPTPNFLADDETICAGNATKLEVRSIDGTTFTWTVEAPEAITGASNSTSPLANFGHIQQTLTSSATTQQTVVYTITPTTAGCSGDAETSTVLVKPTPQVTVYNRNAFSGQDFEIGLSPTISTTQVGWVNADASNVTPLSGGTIASGVLNTKVSTISLADGIIRYVFTPSYDGCTGETKYATITVFAVPVIHASISSIVKGGPPSVLTAEPALATGSGTWYRNGSSWVTAESVTTRTPATYKILVTRGGLTAWTEPLHLESTVNNQNLNYIVTDVVQKEGIKTVGLMTLLTVDSVNQSIQYFDGIGRPMQTVVTQGSPTNLDVVVPNVYDAFGREYKNFLPVTKGMDGSYKNGLIATGDVYSNTATNSFYSGGPFGVASADAPFAKTIYENSPLNRVVKQGSPGTEWQPDVEGAHSVKREYLFNNNTPNDALCVYLFNYNLTGGTIYLGDALAAYYPSNSLNAIKTTDEENNHVIEFTDKEGRVVCKKVWVSSTTYASTYYVYDDFGNLVIVLPPEAIVRINGN